MYVLLKIAAGIILQPLSYGGRTSINILTTSWSSIATALWP